MSEAAKSLNQKISEAIKENDVGFILVPGKDILQTFYWQRPAPEEKTLILNFVKGVIIHFIKDNKLTVAEVKEEVAKLLKEDELV